MRRLSIYARGQLPLSFQELLAADPDVWPALPDHTRRAALILLAELIARAADPSTAQAAGCGNANVPQGHPRRRP